MKSVILFGFLSLVGPVLGGKYELDSGEIVEDNTGIFSPRVDNQANVDGTPAPGGPSPRDLFGRQVCYAPRSYCSYGCCDAGKLCCENTSCMDPADVCCGDGRLCATGQECCRGGGCCGGGLSCAIDSYGNRGCYDFGKTETSTAVPTTIRSTTLDITTLASTTTFATTITPAPTTVPIYTSTRRSCDEAGYTLCPNDQFCCPSGDICYYNPQGQPMCWGGSVYYTYYYYYSWSYSFGVLWYTTSTEYLLGQSNVVSMTAPPPPETPQPTSMAVPSPSGTGNNPPVVTTTPTASMADPGLPAESSMGTPTIRTTTSVANQTGVANQTSTLRGGGAFPSNTFTGGCGALVTGFAGSFSVMVFTVVIAVLGLSY